MKNKNLLRFWLYKGLAMALYAIPLLTYYIVEYIVKERGMGYHIGFTGFLIIIFLVIGFKSKLAVAIRKNLIVSVSIAVLIVAFIAQFLANALMIVSLLSLLGAAASSAVDRVADVYHARCFTTQDGVRKKIRTELLPNKKAWGIAYLGEEVKEDGTAS